jgi:hypothetical protein
MTDNPTSAIAVRGLKELNQLLAKAGPEIAKRARASAREVAEPVRVDAERLARSQISGIRRQVFSSAVSLPTVGRSRSRLQAIRPDWSRMRIGVTRTLVYVAPVMRGHKTGPLRRPNLKPLLLGEAMEPALELHADELEQRIAEHVDRVWRLGASA